MKRAAVWKGPSGTWWADLCHAEDWEPHRPLDSRAGNILAPWDEGYPTHAAALTAAIEAVGLGKTNPEPTEAP